MLNVLMLGKKFAFSGINTFFGELFQAQIPIEVVSHL